MPPGSRRRLPEWAVTVMCGAAVLVVLAFGVAFVRGVFSTYDAAMSGLAKAEQRAKVAEEALRLVQVNGDAGVLLATINTVDFGRAEIRVRPVVNNYQGRK
jgi:hypothetical protein